MKYIVNKTRNCNAKTGIFLQIKQAIKFKSNLLTEFHKRTSVYKKAVVMRRHMIFIRKLFKSIVQELSK